MNGNGTVPLPHDDAERSSIEHDRDLAWGVTGQNVWIALGVSWPASPS